MEIKVGITFECYLTGREFRVVRTTATKIYARDTLTDRPATFSVAVVERALEIAGL